MITMEARGAIRVNENFDSFTAKLRHTMLRKAVAVPARKIARAAKSFAPDRTGALRSSIGSRTRVPGERGTVVHVFIGPLRKVRVPARLVMRGAEAGKFLMAVPTRYAHLMEFGHDIVRNGKVIGHVGPRSFMRKAWALHGGDYAVHEISLSLHTQIEDWMASP